MVGNGVVILSVWKMEVKGEPALAERFTLYD
jgi:hypothetical protein